MATKLTKAGRERTQSLLEQHGNVTDALTKVTKRGFFTGINVTNEGSDFVDVSMSVAVATDALKAQKREIEAELKELGIEIG